MLEYGRFKYVTILVVLLLSVIYALPNVYPQDPSVQVTANRGYKVDAQLQQRVAAALAKVGVQTKAIELDPKDEELLVRLNDVQAQTRASDALTKEIGEHYVVALNLASTVPAWLDAIGAKRILGATATLEYRGVIDGDPYEAIRSGNIPPEAKVYYRKEIGPDGKPIPILLNKRVIATGDQLVTARSGYDQRSGTPMVTVTLNGIGGQRMFDYSSEHVGDPMAVVYIERVPELSTGPNGEEVRTTRTSEQVISVATINGVLGTEFQTTGLESPKEAADLALLLRAGALAAPMDFVEQRVVGPSLGKENVDRGLTAVLYSFGFALAFFLVYYRMFGVITCVALLLNLLMVVAVMSFLGATLTLPGLAGIALTVGMSVDANVLINERIREELRAGVPDSESKNDVASCRCSPEAMIRLLSSTGIGWPSGPVSRRL